MAKIIEPMGLVERSNFKTNYLLYKSQLLEFYTLTPTNGTPDDD